MKEFRIVKQWVKIGENKCVRFKVEQRHTILWFIHYWTSPEFAPPHLFYDGDEAAKSVWIRYPNAVIYDGFSKNKTKG